MTDAKDAATSQNAAAERDSDSLGKGPRKLLLVDDHAELRRSLHDALAAAGYRVHSFATAEALVARGDLIDEADLLIVDLHLPGIQGDELAALLWQRHGPKRVLFISSVAGPPDPDRLRGGGSYGFLEKPFRISVLLRRCRELLGD